jgi:hypothetical protein
MKFRTHIQAKLHLKGNHSRIIKEGEINGIMDDNKYTVFKEFWTQEMIDDLKNMKSMDEVLEMETEINHNEERKQKLDWMLDDKKIEPTEPTPFELSISKKIKENAEKYRNDNLKL